MYLYFLKTYYEHPRLLIYELYNTMLIEPSQGNLIRKAYKTNSHLGISPFYKFTLSNFLDTSSQFQ